MGFGDVSIPLQHSHPGICGGKSERELTFKGLASAEWADIFPDALTSVSRSVARVLLFRSGR